MWVQYLNVINMAIWSYIIKPYILYKDINYNIPEMAKCIFYSLKVSLLSCVIAIPTRILLDNSLFECIILFIVTVLAVLLSSYIFMYNDDRKIVLVYVKKLINNRRLNFRE